MLHLQGFLKTLGCTMYESSAYCAIVENGPLKANDLAIKARIPQGRIYEVITTLANKGWLKKIGNRPSIYDAQNPRHVLQIEMDAMQKKMNESLKDAEQIWELRTGRIGDADDKSWTVCGVHGITLEVRSLLKTVKKSVMITESSLDWLTGSDRNRLADLSKNRINTIVIGTDACIDILRKLVDVGVHSHVTKLHSLAFYIFDEETVLIRLGNPDNGTIVRDTNLAKIFVDKFNKLFKESDMVMVDNIVS